MRNWLVSELFMAFNVKDVLDCGGIDINFNRHHIGPIS